MLNKPYMLALNNINWQGLKIKLIWTFQFLFMDVSMDCDWGWKFVFDSGLPSSPCSFQLLSLTSSVCSFLKRARARNKISLRSCFLGRDGLDIEGGPGVSSHDIYNKTNLVAPKLANKTEGTTTINKSPSRLKPAQLRTLLLHPKSIQSPSLQPARKFPFPLNLSLRHPPNPTTDDLLSFQP